MKVLITGLLAITCSAAAVFAQELLPELAGLAGKHTAAVAEVERQRGEAAAKAAQPYVSALDGVEKAATAKGEIKAVEAAAKEREAALSGRLATDVPAGLPALRLQGTRKAVLDGQYLGALAGLAAKAEPESALAKQVAAEREALLADKKADGGGGDNGGDAKADKVPRGKNVVVNGDFQKIGEDGKPEGWVIWPGWGKGAMLASENGNTFFRATDEPVNMDGTGTQNGTRQTITDPIPPKASMILASVSVRAQPKSIIISKNIWPYLHVQLLDSSSQEISSFQVQARTVSSGKFTTFRSERALPAETRHINLVLYNGKCKGNVDFDDIEVTFK